MAETIVQLRRKNEGAIFTVADAGTRKILHWHRPGETLPFCLWHKGQDYEVTPEDIQQATLKGRVVLAPLDDLDHVDADFDFNRKGVLVGYPRATRWQRFKAWIAKQINKLKGVFK